MSLVTCGLGALCCLSVSIHPHVCILFFYIICDVLMTLLHSKVSPLIYFVYSMTKFRQNEPFCSILHQWIAVWAHICLWMFYGWVVFSQKTKYKILPQIIIKFPIWSNGGLCWPRYNPGLFIILQVEPVWCNAWNAIRNYRVF